MSDTHHLVEVNAEDDSDDYEPNSYSRNTEIEEEGDDINNLEDIVSHHILQDD